ncbi:AAA family ATPase, partial [Paracoccaceae bacterium]|nr:AAA family ATPase [Paracoccaceae bacterium]
MNKNLPEILLWQNYGPPIIGALNLKETSKGEWHGPCPECGGTDRFWINEFKGELYTHCRQCHDYPAIKDKLRDAGLLPRRQPETGENQASTQPQPTSLSEPYHIRKQIDLNLGECSLSGDKLIVQINDIITGEKRGTQTIANSSKLFSKGLVKEGAGTFIGPRTATLLVCEGLADAQALHTTTGHQALFSLDASTIPKNVKLLRENDPSRDIIVCADNDAKGLEAAKKSGVQFSLPSQSGEDWHDVFSRLGVEATKAEFEKNLKKPRLLDSELQAFNIISAEELAQKKFDPIEFLVPELLPAVGLTMLSGAPKVGKSYFCLKLISQFQSSCDVLYLANEDNERRLQQRNSQIFQFGPPPNLLLIPGLSSETPLPRGEAALRFIRQIKQKYPNVGCVFVDTVAGIRERSGREKNYDTTEAEFSALRKLSHELEIAVVAVHHNRKRTESDASPL